MSIIDLSFEIIEMGMLGMPSVVLRCAVPFYGCFFDCCVGFVGCGKWEDGRWLERSIFSPHVVYHSTLIL